MSLYCKLAFHAANDALEARMFFATSLGNSFVRSLVSLILGRGGVGITSMRALVRLSVNFVFGSLALIAERELTVGVATNGTPGVHLMVSPVGGGIGAGR